ncbi:filamin-C-like [Haliotis cracherodii]|uniref:filamin-C-like n=1 Tax=Haliotis cracherodii TaxID=6455 RepID=UPI0039EB937E
MNHFGGARESLHYPDLAQRMQIQKNTFTNWLNEQLKSRNIVIHDVRTDFQDGVNLLALVEELQHRRFGGVLKNPANHYEKLQNVSVALDAISRDGVRIVNIDSAVVTEGNVKLILGLLWQVILRYQVGLSAVQHRQWILKWIQAVIPQYRVRNFTTDWNDGLALHALLEFCKPGICPNWHHLDRDNKLNNCRNAMKLAKQHFDIPLVLRPEDLCSPELDDRSAITYLSYFIRLNAPGYVATIDCVQKRIRNRTITNFTTDWHDGRALCELVKVSGGPIPGWPELRGPSVQTLQQGIEGGRDLGVEPLLTAEEIREENQEHLGIMAYTAQFLPFTQVVTKTDQNLSRTDYNVNKVERASYNTSTSERRNYNVSTTERRNYSYGKADHTDYNVSTKMDINQNRVNMYEDEMSSTHAPTISSQAPSFHLVKSPGTTTNNVNPRVDLQMESYKFDTYSVGVIIDSKMSPPFDPEKIRVEAEAPSGRIIKMTGDGHYTAQFMPSEIGRWRVDLYYNNRLIDGCPIDVCDPSQVRVCELKGGGVAKMQEFKVDCTRAGDGEVGVDITHQGRKVPVTITQSTKGMYRVTYSPYEAGAYSINVHFNRAEVRDSDFHSSDPEERQRKAVFTTTIEQENGLFKIKSSCDWEIDYMTGGPFICHITDSSDIQVYGMQDGTITSAPQLIADCTKVGDGRLEAEVTHNGLRYPGKVKKDKPGIYRVTFKPKGPGVYKIWLHFDGQPVKGSPFIQEIDELQSPVASGEGLERAIVDRPATFTVDPRGFPGNVSVNVHGPTYPIKSMIDPLPDNTLRVHYTPAEKGKHLINVRVDGKDIEESPFKPMVVDPFSVRVSGGWRPFVDDKGVIPLVVDKEKQLPFDASEAGPGELTAEVRGPSGKIPVAVDQRNDGRNTVIFTPREQGKHDIHVRWGGFPLQRSPYMGYATHRPNEPEPEVYPNVRLVQVPLKRPDPVSPKSSFAGSMNGDPYRVSIHGSEPAIYRPPSRPSSVMVPTPIVEATKYYPPTESVPISPKARGPLKVVLSGRGLKEANVDQPATFYVDGSKAGDGIPDADLTKASNGKRVPVHVESVRPRVYKCDYTPREPGAYLLKLKWNDHPLKGSPFRVNVRSPPQPKRVALTGDWAKGGVLGKDLDLRIDPREAGPGELTVKCTGPRREPVPCKLIDNFDGTRRLKVTPSTTGRHIVEIKYDNEHIMGSPYAIDIRASITLGDVKVWGPGLEGPGLMNDFRSHFWVDTTGAGAGELRVRIMGPKGAFHVKMRKASQKDKLYQAFYNPVEPGIYTIYVQWSGHHITGSPYTVLLARNKDELYRLQRDGSVTSNFSKPPSPRDVLY